MKKIILINGPSCAGKSTVISTIFEHKKDFFWLKYDAVKRFFVDYNPVVDKQKVFDLLMVIGKDRMEKGETILVESAIDDFRDIKQCAQDNGYTVYEFNIEAPYELLLARFRERVQKPIQGIVINTSEEKHLDIYNSYIATKNKETTTFDTSTSSAEEIAASILKAIQ